MNAYAFKGLLSFLVTEALIPLSYPLTIESYTTNSANCT